MLKKECKSDACVGVIFERLMKEVKVLNEYVLGLKKAQDEANERAKIQAGKITKIGGVVKGVIKTIMKNNHENIVQNSKIIKEVEYVSANTNVIKSTLDKHEDDISIIKASSKPMRKRKMRNQHAGVKKLKK